MSSPTTRSFDAPGGRSAQQIADFVSAVRGQLNDLSADEVTELTGGLEADLTDALAEAGSTPSELYGDPAEYASELRAAAGLPPRGAGGARHDAGSGFAGRVEQNVVIPFQETYQTTFRKLDAQPWWPGVRDFLVVLRPAWWVVRAWVAVESLFMMLGVGDSTVRGGFGGLVLLVAVIVTSVQIGRHTPLPLTWHRVTVAAWNLVAALLLLPLMFVSVGDGYVDSYDESYPAEPTGLNLGGEVVTNIFPYDSAGRPLTGVQLYDQEGRPLEISDGDRTVFDEDTGTSAELVPGSPVGSAPRWNAFPLQQRTNDQETGELGPVEPAPLPLSGVPSLTAPPTVAPTTTVTASPAPSASKAAKASKPKPTATR